MGNQAQGCERPDEERRVGNGVGEAQAAERRKRIKPVTEAVCPICRGPAGTKPVGLVTRRPSQFQGGAVIDRLAVDCEPGTDERVPYSIHETARR